MGLGKDPLIYTGELTEMGGCFLGWNEGPQTVFMAILESYFGSHMGLSKPLYFKPEEFNKLHARVGADPNAGQNFTSKPLPGEEQAQQQQQQQWGNQQNNQGWGPPQ